jgi:hypothetical protein
MGAVVRELKEDRTPSKPIFKYSEAYHHSRWDDAQPIAVIRALEVALEHGYTRLQLRSNYYHAKNRPHGYSRTNPWCDPVQAKLEEVTKAFAVLHFGPLGRLERQPRTIARKAVAHGKPVPVRERAPYLAPLVVDPWDFAVDPFDFFEDELAPDHDDFEDPPW